jgi:hypothetical protein
VGQARRNGLAGLTCRIATVLIALVLMIPSRNTAGKVTFVRGEDGTSLSGVTFGVGGKHTFASQFVVVSTRPHAVVIASDNMYLYKNLYTHTAISQTLDTQRRT